MYKLNLQSELDYDWVFDDKHLLPFTCNIICSTIRHISFSEKAENQIPEDNLALGLAGVYLID